MPAYSHLNLNDSEAREVDRFDPRRQVGYLFLCGLEIPPDHDGSSGRVRVDQVPV